MTSSDNKSAVVKSSNYQKSTQNKNPYSDAAFSYGRHKPPQKVQLDRIMKVCEHANNQTHKSLNQLQAEIES